MSLARVSPRPAHLPIKLSARTTPLRCVFCHDDLDTAALAACLCGAVLHPDCRATLSRCPTLGCRPHVSAGMSWTTLGEPAQWLVRTLALLGSSLESWICGRPLVALGLILVFFAGVYSIASIELSNLRPYIHSVF